MNGDVLGLPNNIGMQVFNRHLINNDLVDFTCYHTIREPQEKRTIFDATPPSQVVQKVRSMTVLLAEALTPLSAWEDTL